MAYTTNTMDRPLNAFVDLQGRIVATCEQKSVGPNEVYVVIETPFVGRLMTHLGKYLPLGETTVERTAHRVYFDTEKGEMPDGFLIPRAGGWLRVTETSLPAQDPTAAFDWHRLKHAWPLQGTDYDDELLLNVDESESVSYTKGCYLGQEIIARVHYRGRPPRKLSVRAADACTPEEVSRFTSKTAEPGTGRIFGFVFQFEK